MYTSIAVVRWDYAQLESVQTTSQGVVLGVGVE